MSANKRHSRRILLGSSAAGPDNTVEHRQWRNTVQAYSVRAFSHGKDRFIALDGIISRFSRILDDDCLVGIWKKDAIRRLACFTVPPNGRPSLPDVEAPSWSWLSVNGLISYNYQDPKENWNCLKNEFDTLKPRAFVEETYVQADEEHMFSKFSGKLRIRGPVVSAYVSGKIVFFDGQHNQTITSFLRNGAEKREKVLFEDRRRPEQERVIRYE